MSSLWNFGARLQREYWKGKTAREVTSRILNFVVTDDYRSGLRWNSSDSKERFYEAFAEDESVLTRWSVVSPHVDFVARLLEVVDETGLRQLLLEEDGAFDIERTFSPSRSSRKTWIDHLPTQ